MRELGESPYRKEQALLEEKFRKGRARLLEQSLDLPGTQASTIRH